MRLLKVLPKQTIDAAKNVKERWERNFLSNGCILFMYSKYKVIFSVEDHATGRWKHASITVEDKGLPTWGDVQLMKDDFFGPDAYAIQILPPEKEQVNVHEYCMHLWQYLDGSKWPMHKG